jgi:hypothetical protein
VGGTFTSHLKRDVFGALCLPCPSSCPAFRIHQSSTQIPNAYIVALQTQLSMPITVVVLSKTLTSAILTQDLGFESLSQGMGLCYSCFLFVIVLSYVDRNMATADLVS